MVTASDGSPNPVTNKPLTAPSTAPRTMQIAISAGSEVTPDFHSCPNTVQVRPRVLATDRSISPVMTISVSGRAMSTTGMASRVTNRQNRGLATPSTAIAPTTATRTRATTTTTSQVPMARRTPAVRSGMGLPFSQAAPDARGQGPVESDGGEDERADGRVLPERIDAQHRQRGADRGQQNRSEYGAVDRSAAAEDGHSANDDRGDDVELRTDPDVGVEGAESGRVQDSGQARKRSADDERGEDAPAGGYAG